MSTHSEKNTDQALKDILISLFEHSDVLAQYLLPEPRDSQRDKPPSSDIEIILDTSMDIIRGWDSELQARFIAGHPRIGETKNLSTLSAKEQSGGTSQPTPPEVLARLAHLNACYECTYPGLRYITFVNGRSRAVIAEELEDKLRTPHSLSPDQPPIASFVPVEKHSDAWRQELHRAVEDVGRIARSRLTKVVG